MAEPAAAQGTLFRRRGSLLLKFIAFALLSIMLIVIDHRFPEKTLPFRSFMETMAHPLQQIIDSPRIISDWLSERMASHEQLQEENSSLKKRNLLLQQKLQKYGSLEAENIRLRRLLDSSFRFEDDHVLIAEILSVDLDPFNQEIVINKGSLDKVYVGQPVLDATGVMGQVIRVTPTASTILLISSTRHTVPVQNRRNGVRTLATGIGSITKLSLRFVPLESDLETGDVMETSGLGGLFPPGYPVGTITTINHETNNAFAQVEIQPAAKLERSRDVLLVWPSHTDDFPLQEPYQP